MKILCALLAAIPTIPAVAAPAEEVPRTIDAFGRSYDVRHQFSMVLQAEARHRSQGQLRLGPARSRSRILVAQASRRRAGRDLHRRIPSERSPTPALPTTTRLCRPKPESTAYVACLLKVMSEGPQAERYRDAYLASLAANQTLPFFRRTG